MVKTCFRNKDSWVRKEVSSRRPGERMSLSGDLKEQGGLMVTSVTKFIILLFSK